MGKEMRKTYLDALRIIAVFFVIFNHLSGYAVYQVSTGVLQWIYMFVTMITKMNVPLFLMVSGAVLLGREESYTDILKKRVLRFILVIVLFNSLLTITLDYNGLKNMILGIFSGSIEGSYWYLYAYCGMLLTLPFLRKIVHDFEKKDFIWIMVLHFILCSLLPICQYFVSEIWNVELVINANLKLPLMTEKVFFYPLIGYYLDKMICIDNIKKKHLGVLAILAVIGIEISCIMTYHEGVRQGFTSNFVVLFDYVIAIAVFMTVKYVFTKAAILQQKNLNKIISEVGQLTFGIYLLDPLARAVIYPQMKMRLEPAVPTIITSGMWCVCSIIICGGGNLCSEKNPRFKKDYLATAV